MKDEDVRESRSQHDGCNLKRGPKTDLRDQQPDRARELEKPGQIPKPLPQPNLSKFLHQTGVADQLDPAGKGECDGQKNGENPGEDTANDESRAASTVLDHIEPPHR